MATFFILLSIVFVPFIWYVVRAIRYTDETIGEHSPLYVVRTYQVSAWEYFGKLDKILLIALVPLMLLLVRICVVVAVNQQAIGWLFVPFFLGFAGYIVFYFYVDWEYWEATRDVAVTMNPHQPSLTIDSPAQSSFLTPDNVVRIEHHCRKSGNSKEPFYAYGYVVFYRADDQTVRVNNIFFLHVEFLERFFGHVPNAIVWHRLPRIRKDARTDLTQPPNFAAQHPR